MVKTAGRPQGDGASRHVLLEKGDRSRKAAGQVPQPDRAVSDCRPSLTPRALADARPDVTRSVIRSRSNSANPTGPHHIFLPASLFSRPQRRIVLLQARLCSGIGDAI
jgi:hypothetical protein